MPISKGRGLGGWAALCAAALLSAAPAGAAVAASAQMPRSVQVEGRPLTLQSAGVERRLFSDVFAWGLYLEHAAQSARNALSTGGARQLRFHLRRGVSSRQLADGVRDSLGDAASMRSPAMRSGLERLCAALGDVRRGDELVITYRPGEGTRIAGQVREAALIPGKDFADALFEAWLKENPL
jgi:hypothetical protein